MSDDRNPQRPSAARRPGAFRVEGQEVGTGPSRASNTFAEPEAPSARSPRALPDLAALTIEPDDAIERADDLASLDPIVAVPRRRGFSFGKLFLTALGALVSIAIGLAIDGIVRDLFARNEWLGWAGLAVTALLVLGALGMAGREMLALSRLSAVDRERKAGQKAYDTDSSRDAESVVAGLVTLVRDKPETAEGRARLAALKDDVIDGRDLIALAERELLSPLDSKARALILGSSKRVSVVTAVSPKALVDVAFVLFETVRLIRTMSELYGARPGTIGLVKLTRDVLGHLAVTGSISIGDNVIGQVVGHGVAARLSARLGEGIVNGLLTARVGLAAMDLCRPLPFLRQRRPRIGDFLSDLARLQGDAAKPQGAPPREN